MESEWEGRSIADSIHDHLDPRMTLMRIWLLVFGSSRDVRS